MALEQRRFMRPGFRTLLPVQVGKYMAKISSSEQPTIMMIVYWEGDPEPSKWLDQGRKTAQIHYCSNEDDAKKFLNMLEHKA